MLTKELRKSWYCPGCGEPGYDNYCPGCQAILDELNNCMDCSRPIPFPGLCDRCKAKDKEVEVL